MVESTANGGVLQSHYLFSNTQVLVHSKSLQHGQDMILIYFIAFQPKCHVRGSSCSYTYMSLTCSTKYRSPSLHVTYHHERQKEQKISICCRHFTVITIYIPGIIHRYLPSRAFQFVFRFSFRLSLSLHNITIFSVSFSLSPDACFHIFWLKT